MLAPDKDTIRNFRARVLRRELGDLLYGMARDSSDFYSISGCRDLIFHYQEHRYTLPRLRMELRELNLDFIGFQDIKIANLYRQHFPQDKDMRNLELWDQFEHMYPKTFGKMYQFWCQKRRKDA